ncbi:MAG: DUF5815 family protein [Halobacteriales archaeon]
MSDSSVPGEGGEVLTLPCGEAVSSGETDVGMREYPCDCGRDHALVADVHPPTRFFPADLVEMLASTVEVEDEFEEFGTPHLMGMVMEEYPDEVVAADVSDDGDLGFGIVWMTDFDSRRLHEILVELVVEMMEHAVSHTEDDSAMSEFQRQMQQFDPGAFVERYRDQRDFDDPR